MKIGKIDFQEFTDSQLNLQGCESLGFSLDSVVKTALFTTLSGYLEKDNITVYDSAYAPALYLNNFLSYVLNDKRAAPKKFNLNITYQEKISKIVAENKNKIDCILSFSGGIDSTAGLMYALDKKISVLPMWIGFGQKNEAQELQTVKKICKHFSLEPLIVRVNMSQYVDAGWSRWKQGIIPARNFLFASIAACLVSHSSRPKTTIFICAHKEEITPVNTDKSPRFYKTTTKLFSKAYQKDISVATPFAEYTKPEIISFWVHNWAKKYKINPDQTVSCYFGNNCGVCKACINRAVAFACVGIKSKTFANNPFKDSQNLIQSGYIERFDSLEFERQLDFLYALHANLNILPKNLKEFVNANFPKYQKEVSKRNVYLQKAIIR